MSEIADTFCRRYRCDRSDFLIHKGSGSNRQKTHLVITNAGTALRVLLHEGRNTSEDDAAIDLTAEDADDGGVTESYDPQDGDHRAVVNRQIKERQGQPQFRDALLERYENRCLITGCEVLDALEAAHIKPYLGKNDDNPQNGLLLRADIHTLFDLDLIGIEPDELRVELHPTLARDEHYKSLAGKTLLCKPRRGPSPHALTLRYIEFRNRLKR